MFDHIFANGVTVLEIVISRTINFSKENELSSITWMTVSFEAREESTFYNFYVMMLYFLDYNHALLYKIKIISTSPT